jgi:ubiquitin-protein ligase
MASSNENLTPAAINSLTKELSQMLTKPEEGIRIFMNEQNIADIVAEIEGPAGTPYEGGSFRMKLALPGDFPNSAPKGFFITKVFHPNIRQPSGEICVNTLKKDWQPTHGIRHILKVIRCLLIQPFPDSALNEEAAKLMNEDFEEFSKHAKMMTSIHARPSDKRVQGTTCAEEVNGLISPTKKKAKPDKKTLERKKSLKRL